MSMSILGSMFGRARHKPPQETRAPRRAGLGVTATRGQLVRMAHRDTLRRCGIQEQWLTIEALAAKDTRGELGVHARFVVKNGDPELIVHLPQLLDLVRSRLGKLDPSSRHWLCGTSVRFDLPSDHVHEPMPPAGFRGGTERPAEPSAATEPAAPADSPRDWLDRMFAASPRIQPHADFRPTQPMYGHPES